ncbi:hypothetical protein EDB84DRAFT_261976 [Lactarius hengduanensis]|nr:hypothetical protein EDB84DRAFT_261976 [Lactarius hengduanensis]
MATRVNQLGLPSADTDARANRPSPPYSSFPSPSISPLSPSPTSEPQHHRNMFLGDDLDTPADTSLAPSPVPQSTHFNGDESDNMQVDSDDDARDADADADADIDADGDYVEESEQVPVNSNTMRMRMRTAHMETRNMVAAAAAAGRRYSRKKRYHPSPKWHPDQLLQTRIRSTALGPKRRRNRVCRVTRCGPLAGASKYSTMPTMSRTLSNSMNPTQVIISTLTLKRKRTTRSKLSLAMRGTRDTRTTPKTFGTKTS